MRTIRVSACLLAASVLAGCAFLDRQESVEGDYESGLGVWLVAENGAGIPFDVTLRVNGFENALVKEETFRVAAGDTVQRQWALPAPDEYTATLAYAWDRSNDAGSGDNRVAFASWDCAGLSKITWRIHQTSNFTGSQNALKTCVEDE